MPSFSLRLLAAAPMAAVLAHAAAAAPAHAIATGASLAVELPCVRQVTIAPDAALAGQAVLDATADHPEEIAQVAVRQWCRGQTAYRGGGMLAPRRH